ncbi:cache domain-containing sensor histidine kinase [Paenibacillus piri]|uniref:HAMP domain-containing protein n=1 Tax=Paenibacillus piri TaxID=2547395 RepID=A0A4R5KKE9_9BACL|nr:histidine kinase [Paenibacillus piri]TDF94840.1 HAMP domain-containing protein [Paenibacillus piri]
MAGSITAIYKRARSLSLKSKLFITLILISLIPVFFVSFASQYLIIRSSTNGTAALSTQIVKYIASDINAYLLNMNESLNTFVINSDFQKFLTVPKNDIQAQAAYAISFRPLLQLLAQSKKEIRGVLYMDKQGKVYSESQKVNLDIHYPIFADPAYNQIARMTSEGLTAPHPQNYAINGKNEVITFVKPVNRIQNNTLSAWILVEIDANWIWDIMNKSTFGDKGQVLLYSPSNDELILNAEQTAMHVELRKKMHAFTEPSGEFNFVYDGTSYLVTYDTIHIANWRFVGITPLEEMAKGVRQSRLITLAVAAASLVLALVIAFPSMGIVLKPLYRLKRGMQMLGRGSSVPIEHSIPDEIGFLIKTYNQMLGDLETMRKEVIDTKLREKEKELLQLQAQINPHFLFNTLETVESYSLINNGAAVSDMLQCVSRMLRYNVRNDGGWAPLREEIDYIHDFLSIHKYRNERRVNTVFDIAEELLDMPVMKLSIQPFVENSLKYGWNPLLKQNDFQLKVIVWQSGAQLQIKIQDNGAGIPDEVIGLLQALTLSAEKSTEPYFKQHTGIFNVYRRYALAYGDGFSMQIGRNEEAGSGAIVTIVIPGTTGWQS